nr:MAG TPA: hypothetical protein [Caudoviricetes sp.]
MVLSYLMYLTDIISSHTFLFPKGWAHSSIIYENGILLVWEVMEMRGGA